MRRKYSIEKILLDSTYLLPILGVSVSGIDKILKVLERLHRSNAVEIYYAYFSILKIMGKLSKIKYGLNVVEAELSSIMENFKTSTSYNGSYLMVLDSNP